MEEHNTPFVFIAPSNIGDFEVQDRNVIIGKWESALGITSCIEELTTRATIKEDGGIVI